MPRDEQSTPLGASIGEIVDRTTKIVHEEIELAKAEMSIALQDLLRGSVAGIVGGVFAFFGLFILLIALSFLIADAIGVLYPWLGFFIVAFFCFLIGGALAWVALKKIKKGSQVVPSQAIDEAKQTREALQGTGEKDHDAIESVAVEEPVPSAEVVATAAQPPAPAKSSIPGVTPEPAVPLPPTEVTAAQSDAELAREQAGELELDAKEAKKRAKQEAKEAKREAKEAKEAEKAARKAEQEAAKAAAIAKQQEEQAEAAAAKEREQAEKQAAKEREQAEKLAAKERAKAEKQAAKQAKKRGGPGADEVQQIAPPEQPPAQPYVAPPVQPQTPPAPPSAQPQPPAPPSDPSAPNEPTEGS